MKVSINQSENKSIFGKIKGYFVSYRVEFSDEEKAIIKQKNLFDTPVFEWEDGMVTIKKLLQGGNLASFPNPVTAQNAAEHLKQHFKDLKEFITASTEGPKSESFEL